jgi:hypothetical protein
MKKSRGGWGKYAREHRAKIGDKIILNGKYWTIYSQSENKLRIEDDKTKYEADQTKRLADPKWINFKEKYPQMNMEYIFRIQKIQRQINYKPYDYYRLLRREKSS